MNPYSTKKSILNPSPIPPRLKSNSGPQRPERSIHQVRKRVGDISKSVNYVDKCVGQMCQAVDIWDGLQNELRQRRQNQSIQNQSPMDMMRLIGELDLTPWQQFLQSPQTLDMISYFTSRRR